MYTIFVNDLCGALGVLVIHLRYELVAEIQALIMLVFCKI